MSANTELTPELVASLEALMAKINSALKGEDHAMALDALMQLYRFYALHYSCCTFGCAVQAGKVASELMLKAHRSPVSDQSTAVH